MDEIESVSESDQNRVWLEGTESVIDRRSELDSDGEFVASLSKEEVWDEYERCRRQASTGELEKLRGALESRLDEMGFHEGFDESGRRGIYVIGVDANEARTEHMFHQWLEAQEKNETVTLRSLKEGLAELDKEIIEESQKDGLPPVWIARPN